MTLWTLADGGKRSDLAHHALSSVISRIGAADFADAVLGDINQAFDVGSWSVYRTSPDTGPVCYHSGSYRRRDTTASCFLAYRRGIYRKDRTFDVLAGHAGSHRVAIIHLAAENVPTPDHRRAIYEHHQLRERLSVARLDGAGSVLTVNLYRHVDQRGYTERDMQLSESMAQGVLASVERHIELAPTLSDYRSAVPAPGNLPRSRHDGGSMRDTLHSLAPGLTSREMEVCLRILQGMSHAGIACDLGISATTVKTYRNRAFARLGVHHNNELFARVLGGASLQTR